MQICENLYPYSSDGETLWETPYNSHPYGSHPHTILSGVYPCREITAKSPLAKAAIKTWHIVTNLIGFHYQDRHKAIPRHSGGMEPVGFGSTTMLTCAACLGMAEEFLNFFYQVVVRINLKPNGLMSLADPRHSREIECSADVEASSNVAVAISESLMGIEDGYVVLFPVWAKVKDATARFANLRAPGAFLVSSEIRKGEVKYITIRGMARGTSKVKNPWESRVQLIVNFGVVDMLEGEALSFETKPGILYMLVPEGSSWDSIEVEELRNDGGIKPRRITEKDAELHGSTVNYYPESPPSCQPLDDGWIYLGLPNNPSNKGLMEDSVNLIKMLDDEYWTIRQDAARRLAHCKPTRETISALAKIAASDEAQVVRVTAAVSLINLRTPEAIKMVIKIL